MTPSPDHGAAIPAPGGSGGDVLDQRYELCRTLGEGGMGVVYHARDRSLGRDVAVKVFRDGATDLERSASETKLLASLNHPALVTLFDANVSGDGPRYIVMEYVDGPTLHARLKKAPLSPTAVGAIARDLGEALHVVHAAGIVHRDIKPANVLLRTSGVAGREFHAKLADFGIAYLIDSTRITTPGMVIGSAAYLSPEQLTGSTPGPASDIYALGLVLLEALTGTRGFEQDSPHESAIARLSQQPVIPSTVGHEWGALLEAMTARDPDARPTALEVAARAASIDTASRSSATVAAPAAAAPRRPRDDVDDAPTLVAPVAPTATTRVDHPPTLIAEPEAPPTDGRKRRSGFVWLTGAASAVVLASIVLVGAAIWAPRTEPTPAPTLPAMEEPLGTHLQQLLTSVSP